MDGNRRFAKARGWPTSMGHKAGYEVFKEFLEWAGEAGVKEVVAYCFSTENWKRAKEEVTFLMELLLVGLSELQKDFKNSQFHFVGDLSQFDPKLRAQMEKIEVETAKATGPKVYLALSYGGRSEILAATKKLVASGKEINEENFNTALYTSGMKDPDLIIRTGGEKRLSNFLPWQSVYSELFFIDTLWPAFTKEEFEAILGAYDRRERRFGV
jgi:undecaprenyl diphosphate synthase